MKIFSPAISRLVRLRYWRIEHWVKRPDRCRCTTSSWCTGRSRIAAVTAASAWRFATSRPMCASRRCGMPPRWCAVAIRTITSIWNHGRVPTWIRLQLRRTPIRSAARPNRCTMDPPGEVLVERRFRLYIAHHKSNLT